MPDEVIEVTVASLGEPRRDEDPMSAAEFDRSDADRPRVLLQVSPDDTLGEVLGRAARELDIQHPAVSVAFYDRQRDVITATGGTITLVDTNGRATWMHPVQDVTYRELRESVEAGVLAIDPQRLYVQVGYGVGDGAVPDWETVKAIWDALDFVLGAVGAVTTLNEARKRVAARLRRKAQSASEVIEQRSADWQSRGGDPSALRGWLDNRVWSSADLASVLGCTEPEAEAVLWSFGFAHSPSCVWRLAADEESKFLNEVHGLGYAVTGASQEQVRRALDTKARQFLKSGKAPGIEWQDLDWLHPSPVHRTVARVVTWLHRVTERLRRNR